MLYGIDKKTGATTNLHLSICNSKTKDILRVHDQVKESGYFAKIIDFGKFLGGIKRPVTQLAFAILD